jgi:organic radical activating enzyme
MKHYFKELNKIISKNYAVKCQVAIQDLSTKDPEFTGSGRLFTVQINNKRYQYQIIQEGHQQDKFFIKVPGYYFSIIKEDVAPKEDQRILTAIFIHFKNDQKALQKIYPINKHIYTPFEETIEEKDGKLINIFVKVFITYTCNLHCIFCDVDASQIVVPLDQIKQAFASIKKIHNEHLDKVTIVLTGGEPTTAPHIIPVLQHTKKMGFKSIGMCSNSLLLHKKVFLNKLISAGLNTLNITFHSDKEVIYDKILRREKRPGAKSRYQKFILATNNLLDAPLKSISFGVAITKYNYKKFINIAKFVVDFEKHQKHDTKVGLSTTLITKNEIHPDTNWKELIISPKEAQPYLKKAYDYIRKTNVIPLSQ